MSPAASRWLKIVAAALTVWYLSVVFIWALRPLHDAIPIGLDPRTNAPVSKTVECNTLFESGAHDKPLPDLKLTAPVRDTLAKDHKNYVVSDPALLKKYPQLAGWTGYVYNRTGCITVHNQARIVFGLDTLGYLVAMGAVGAVAVRLRRTPAPPPIKPLMAAASA